MAQTKPCPIIDFGTAAALHDLHTHVATQNTHPSQRLRIAEGQTDAYGLVGPTEYEKQGAAKPDVPVSGCVGSYVARTRPNMNVLICKSVATFAVVRNLMKKRHQRRFFGIRIDAVVYGGNGVVSRAWGLESFERNLGNGQGVCHTVLGGAYRPTITYFYWGDISRQSVMDILDVYRANSGRMIRPFAPAYRYMLDKAFGRKLPVVEERPESSFFLRLERFFTPMQQSTYRSVLSNHQRIPQEIVTERVLRKLSRVAC